MHGLRRLATMYKLSSLAAMQGLSTLATMQGLSRLAAMRGQNRLATIQCLSKLAEKQGLSRLAAMRGQSRLAAMHGLRRPAIMHGLRRFVTMHRLSRLAGMHGLSRIATMHGLRRLAAMHGLRRLATMYKLHSSPFPLRTSTPDKGARYINSPSALVCDWFPRSACVFVAIAPLRPCCAPIMLPFRLYLAELCPFLWAWPSGPSAHPALRLWLVSLRSYLAYLCRPHASFALDSCRPFVPAFAGGSLYLAPLVAFHSHGLGLCLLPRLPP